MGKACGMKNDVKKGKSLNSAAKKQKTKVPKQRTQKRRTKEICEAQLLMNKSGAENQDKTRNRLKFKLLEKNLNNPNRPRELRMKDLFEYGKLYCSLQNLEKGLKAFDELIEMDPTDPVGCGLHYICMLMDNTEADRARDMLDKLPTLKESAIGAYVIALIEYISSAVLEEEGSDFDVATTLLKKAAKMNPYIAEFIAFHEVFTDKFYPETVEELVGWDRIESDKQVHEALQYLTMFGQMSVWLDCEGSEYWVKNTIFKDEEYAATNEPLGDLGHKNGHKKLCVFWGQARQTAMEEYMNEDEEAEQVEDSADEVEDMDDEELLDQEMGSDEEEMSDEDVEIEDGEDVDEDDDFSDDEAPELVEAESDEE